MNKKQEIVKGVENTPHGIKYFNSSGDLMDLLSSLESEELDTWYAQYLEPKKGSITQAMLIIKLARQAGTLGSLGGPPAIYNVVSLFGSQWVSGEIEKLLSQVGNWSPDSPASHSQLKVLKSYQFRYYGKSFPVPSGSTYASVRREIEALKLLLEVRDTQ